MAVVSIAVVLWTALVVAHAYDLPLYGTFGFLSVLLVVGTIAFSARERSAWMAAAIVVTLGVAGGAAFYAFRTEFDLVDARYPAPMSSVRPG